MFPRFQLCLLCENDNYEKASTVTNGNDRLRKEYYVGLIAGALAVVLCEQEISDSTVCGAPSPLSFFAGTYKRLKPNKKICVFPVNTDRR